MRNTFMTSIKATALLGTLLRGTLLFGAILFGTILVGILLSTSASNAQTADTWSRPQTGAFGAFQLVQHTMGTSTGIINLSSCGTFTDGSGIGVAFGWLYQYPLIPHLALQVRGSYSIMGGSLSSREVIGNGVEGGRVVNAEVEHTLDPLIAISSLEPTLSWAPFDFPLGINIGFQVGRVTSKTAEQKETLLTPRTATFTNGSAVRNAGSGEFDAGDFYAATVTGLSFDIPVGTDYVVAPEVAYHFNVGNLGSSAAWRGDALRLGVSVKRLFGTPSTPTVEGPSGLSASVRASGLLADSSEQPIVQVQIEEFLGAQLRPLLNYVFYDDNSGILPARYKRLTQDQALAFSIDKLHYLDALETYHQILNIVGRRMIEHPEAKLRLVGCNAETPTERGNTALAEGRAVSVRDYLVQTWNIPQERITVEKRGLPEKPSNTNDRDGIAENRRVELYSDNVHILEPVLTNDTVRSANPPGIRFRSTVASEAGVASWRLTAGQKGETLKEFSGTGAVPSMLDWHLEEDQAHVPHFPIPIDYQLAVTDTKGQSYTVPKATIQTDQVTIQRKRRERRADKEINRYSLILFDFGSADISAGNRSIVDFIKSRITLNSTVSVTGYTDRLGDADFNQKLSEQRARATTDALGVGRPVGQGETPLFDNNLPEGRFYCRTVNVVVEVPIGQ